MVTQVIYNISNVALQRCCCLWSGLQTAVAFRIALLCKTDTKQTSFRLPNVGLFTSMITLFFALAINLNESIYFVLYTVYSNKKLRRPRTYYIYSFNILWTKNYNLLYHSTPVYFSLTKRKLYKLQINISYNLHFFFIHTGCNSRHWSNN